MLENVAIDEHGTLDLDDESKTENTRAAYKLEQIPNALPTKRAGHPTNVVFLTADAFGDPAADRAADPRPGPLLLPLRLHGEARGHRDRRHRAAADLLDLLRRAVPAAAAGGLRATCSAQKLEQHRPTVWLVNTGWTGGPYGEGSRMPIQATRALLHAALSGRARGGRVPHRRDLRLRGPGRGARRRREAARPARDLARPGGLRPQGERARHDVPRELRAVPGCGRRGADAGPRGLTQRAGPFVVETDGDGGKARRPRRRRRAARACARRSQRSMQAPTSR